MIYFFVEGVHITTTVSTQVNGKVGSWFTPDVMDLTIDVNRYKLDLSGITSLVFKLKRCGRAHVLLSSSDFRISSEPMYEIDIGFDIYETYIIYRADDSLDSDSRIFSKFLTPNIFNCTVYLPFWISWADGDIKLGTGIVVDENVLGYLTNAPQFEVKAIGVLTSYGMLGSWRIQFEGTGDIIKYDRGSDEVEQVNPNDVDYQIYKKNVEHDFVDVRTYGFRPNDTNDKLLLMAKFAFDKELFVCKK
ncbi:unnamed protein product [Mytilus edulis]|uniref:Farnesoic acid O-methyl transferase domain-containing protein n=1 Tax=Mytilus edulis TaxID=6550 RepID=A0A8S3RAI2_MYTED|nr:unnamed protein product [Mytilus edulis]